MFDIELAENDPDKLVEIIAAMEPTLGGINLEDIKAPECFYIEKKLLDHFDCFDDQHGTAIISSAALINGLELVGKRIEDIKSAVSGASATALACLNVMVGLGVRMENDVCMRLQRRNLRRPPRWLRRIKARFAKTPPPVP